METILVLLIWVLLGWHSVSFFKERFTLYHDLTTDERWMLVFCFVLPIISHVATYMVYPKIRDKKEPKILRHKQCQ